MCTKTGNDNHYQQLTVFDRRHEGLEENTILGKQWNASLDFLGLLFVASKQGMLLTE
jgi:hypothetical protein